MGRWRRFVAVDWSGARGREQPGIAVAACGMGEDVPALVPPPGRRWSREAVLAWLEDVGASREAMLIGVDLSPALPFVDAGAYFPGWPDSPPDMRALWALVDRLAADDPHLGVDGVVADPAIARHLRVTGAAGDLFPPGRGRLRLCEQRQRALGLSPSSCFNLVGAAQVGKSSLTGMRVLHRLGGRIPLWPLDPVPAEGPMMVEIYTSLAARAAGLPRGRSKMRDAGALDAALDRLGVGPHAPLPAYDDHLTDALLTAAWLRTAAGRPALWRPEAWEAVAASEGWTFGVP